MVQSKTQHYYYFWHYFIRPKVSLVVEAVGTLVSVLAYDNSSAALCVHDEDRINRK